jgi:hypothetical protein
MDPQENIFRPCPIEKSNASRSIKVYAVLKA